MAVQTSDRMINGVSVSDDARKCLLIAKQNAKRLGRATTSKAQILHGLVAGDCFATKALVADVATLNRPAVLAVLQTFDDSAIGDSVDEPPFTDDSEAVLKRASALADDGGMILCEHILRALIDFRAGSKYEGFFEELGLTPQVFNIRLRKLKV